MDQLSRLLAAASALNIASVHVAILNQHLEEKTYVGALFLAAAAWTGGTAVVASMFALFVVSRAAGLPGYHEPWDKIGIASLALEGLFLTTAVANVLLGRMRETGERVAASAAVHRDVAASRWRGAAFTIEAVDSRCTDTAHRRIEGCMRLVRMPVDASGALSLAWRSSPPIAGAVPRHSRDSLRSDR